MNGKLLTYWVLSLVSKIPQNRFHKYGCLGTHKKGLGPNALQKLCYLVLAFLASFSLSWGLFQVSIYFWQSCSLGSLCVFVHFAFFGVSLCLGWRI